MLDRISQACAVVRTRLPGILLGLLLMGGLSLALLDFPSLPKRGRPAAAITLLEKRTLPALHKVQPHHSQGSMLPSQSPRKAGAASSGELDGSADVVYGQRDFTTGAAPGSTDETTLHQAADVFVYDLTLQIFVADTANNRVLGWQSTHEYVMGDPATVVLGQPDYSSTDAANSPTAASMNGPTGVAMGEDGILYVSDTGNHRVLVFMPYNLCEYYNVIDDVYCFDGHPFSDYYRPIFLDGMEADYALGQPDLVSNSLRPTGPTTLNHPMGLAVDYDDNLVVADHGNNRVVVYEWPLKNDKSISWIVGQDAGQDGTQDVARANAAPNPPHPIEHEGANRRGDPSRRKSTLCG